MTLPIHPACSIFPAMSDEELRRLADDIARNGLLQPIVLYEGAVLDGRNRLRACEMAAVAPKFVEFTQDGSPIAWVVAQNICRRHLSSSQKAVLALELLPLLEKEARQRKQRGLKQNAPWGNKFPHGKESGKSKDVAAELVGTNPQYVMLAKQVQSHCPDLLPLVSSGAVNLQHAALAERLTAPGATILHIQTRLDATAWPVFPADRQGVCASVLNMPEMAEV